METMTETVEETTEQKRVWDKTSEEITVKDAAGLPTVASARWSPRWRRPKRPPRPPRRTDPSEGEPQRLSFLP